MPKLFKRKVTKIMLLDQCVRFSLDEADDDNIPTFFDLLNHNDLLSQLWLKKSISQKSKFFKILTIFEN